MTDLRYLEVSPHEADGGFYVGRNPSDVSVSDLEALGHPTGLSKAIRAKCMDCCADNAAEVRKCVQHSCPLWPMRMGSSPFHAKARKAREGKE